MIIRRGDRVATLLDDAAPAVTLMHVVHRLGGVHVPLNRRAAEPELARQLALLRPTAIVHDEKRAHLAWSLARALSCRALTVPELEAHDTPSNIPAEDLDAPATIVFTSGTTAEPRAAVLSHANLRASADAWGAVLAPRPDDRWLLSLPLHHVAGLAIAMRAHHWRAGLAFPTALGAEALAAGIDAGASHLSLVPTQLHDLLETWGHRPVPPTLRAVLLGGAPIPGPALARARASGFPVLTTYGMTETASGIAVGGADAETLAEASAVRPLPGVELRIADRDAAGSGEIEISGAMVFRGYAGDAAASAAMLHDGWLRTGDLGRLDDAGLLRVIGRRDDVIISGGENVHPAEVEAVLRSLPEILDAAVVGIPDERLGSVAVAAIVLAPGAGPGDDELRRHCRERLSGHKVPHTFHRVARIPRNRGGKILRSQLGDILHP